MISPPAFRMRSRAFSVTWSAASLDFGAVEYPVVIGDGADDNDDLSIPARLLHLPGDLGNGYWRPVDLGHEEAPEDDAVELGIRTAGQETVQLNKEPQVDILGLRLGTVDLSVLFV